MLLICAGAQPEAPNSAITSHTAVSTSRLPSSFTSCGLPIKRLKSHVNLPWVEGDEGAVSSNCPVKLST
jgi:hypothetical protein